MLTDLLERSTTPNVVELPVAAEQRTPPRPPDTATPAPTPNRWPPRAVAAVVALAVIALVLGVAAIVGFTTGDDAADTTELDQTIATLTAERDDLTNDVAARDETIATLTVERNDLVVQADDLQADLDATIAERDQLLVSTDAQAGTIADLDATIATLTAERADLVAEIAVLEARIDQQAVDTEAAIAERDALLALFPIAVDTELDPAAVPGGYEVDLDQVYCSGFGNCTTLTAIGNLTIRGTADGRLELDIPGYPVAGLAELDGVLHAVMDVPVTDPATGTTRMARTTVDVFAGDVSVAEDGTQTITDLGGSLTMYAPATPTDAVGTAVYSLELTPQN